MILSERSLEGKVVLVTGASRGIGAVVAEKAAQRGADVGLNYRSKAHRAEEVAETVRAAGRRALVLQADLTVDADVAAMADQVRAAFGGVDVLVLNAAGGLEKDKPETYAMEINCYAQLRVVERFRPLLRTGGRILYLTSHMAHYHGERPSWPDYEPVAASKKACEVGLRNKLAEFDQAGLRLVIVSGDLIEGTITPKLLNRKNHGVLDVRREQVGFLPTVDDFAGEVVRTAADPAVRNGETVFVGSTEPYPID